MAGVDTMSSSDELVMNGENLVFSNNSVFMDITTCTQLTFRMNIQPLSIGRALTQAVSRWLPTAVARVPSPGQVMWYLWWTKWRWGKFSPSTSDFPANLHSTNCSTITIIYHLGLVK
jgi:hypothetical protein